MGSWFCDRPRLNFLAFARRGIYITAKRAVMLAVWTVHVLDKVSFYCFGVPREINLRFCSKTQWQMFLSISVRHVGAHVDGHHYGVSIQISINLGKTFLRRHISLNKNCCDLNLSKSFCIFTFFLFADSGLYLYFYFYLDMAWHWKPAIGHFRVLLCLCFKASLSAKPFLWKWVLHAVSFSRKSTSFS